MTEKDYSLLRPFDLDAAKGGAKVVETSDSEWLNGVGLYVSGPNEIEEIVFDFGKFGFLIYKPHHLTSLRLNPLCWVEGKPVYPGDVLERENGKAFIPDMVAISGELRMLGEGLPSFLNPELLRWPRPKPVKRRINIYPEMYSDGSHVFMYASKEHADENAGTGRIACIEIELPPLPTK